MGRMILIPGADFSEVNLGQATLVDYLPIEGITIDGPAGAVGFATYRAKLWPTFTTDREVLWSVIEGSDYAEINAYTGELSVKQGASQNKAVIRATSTTQPSVFADKVVNCTAGTMTFKDYLTSDGTAFILIKEFRRLFGATVTVRGYVTNPNGHLYSAQKADVANAQTSFYLRDNGTTARARCGSRSALNITSTNATTTRMRVIFNLSDGTTNNGSVVCYNDITDDLIANVGDAATMYIDSSISIFCAGTGEIDGEFTPNEATFSTGKFYGLKIEKDGTVIANYRPAVVNDTPCIYDEASGKMYFNEAESGLTAADDE